MESLKDAGSIGVALTHPQTYRQRGAALPQETQTADARAVAPFWSSHCSLWGSHGSGLPLFPFLTIKSNPLLGRRCLKGVLPLPTSATERSCWLWLQCHSLALLSTSQVFLSSSLCSRPFTKEKVEMEWLGEDPAPLMLLRSKAGPSSHSQEPQ